MYIINTKILDPNVDKIRKKHIESQVNNFSYRLFGLQEDVFADVLDENQLLDKFEILIYYRWLEKVW